MGYELFAYAIVVALMAIYVYNNERRMGEMFYKLDQTAQLQQVLHFVDTKFAEIEKKTETKLQEADNRHKLTTDHLQKKIDDITKLTQLQQQQMDSLDNKMADIEKKNEMKLKDTENRNNLTISHLQKQIKDITEIQRIQSGIEMYPFCKRKLNRRRGRKHHKSCFKVKDALKSSVTCLNIHGFTFQPYDWSIISTA